MASLISQRNSLLQYLPLAFAGQSEAWRRLANEPLGGGC
jgi:hypothetical protein